ncbi:sugar/nucleoside kinase (ribokinase family) [Marinimicrobium koreense]|uniref:Sugar/nucleoside kinase (Ribokinase family) n=1 Tax=Marinimicrobium koreense TaxID=306545 RepID=A0A3N1NXM9_9GAMM|nr:adenosine kinase [Marinimicrobium koreense]ROQ20933.1 sugar/nucleoside kinase (ribokinase family) [Marinimicrobium koreense]
MNDHYHIYGIGAALVDTEIEVSDADLKAMAVAKGVMTLVDEPRQSELIDYLSDHLVHSNRASGGSGANTVIAASYFGCRSFYSCRVANDENGEFYLNDIKAAGVDYPEHLGSDEGITGKCLVMITPDAERSMNTFLGISAGLSVNQLHTPAIDAADYVYIEGYLVSSDTGRAAAIELRERAEKRNTLTALSLSDPAMVQFFRDGLLEMIGKGVDLLFCNREEAMGFTGTNTLEEAAQSLQDYCRSFAITCGADGALVFDGRHSYHIDAQPVKAVDTNGAGDMFAGAFLYALSQGHGYDVAGRFASLAASKVVTQYGPRLRPEQHQELKQAFFG